MQVFFGLVLIYSGFKTAWTDDDDDDPRENRCVQLITRCLPISDSYDDSGALFARVLITSKPSVQTDPHIFGAASGPATEDIPELEPGTARDGSGGTPAQDEEKAMRGTMLLLVVVVLGVIDVIFAVDSVTAKIAEYDNTFINFSSSAFAMLCLRSMYFVLIRLLKYFRFLKYGVAAILVLIGIKLIVSKWVKVEEIVSLAIICGVFFLSMVVSIIFPAEEEYGEQNDEVIGGMYPLEIQRAERQVLDDDDLPMPEDFEIELT